MFVPTLLKWLALIWIESIKKRGSIQNIGLSKYVIRIKENINKEEEVAVIVEQVNAMPGQGVTSMFNFGQTFGALKGICAALELPIFFCKAIKVEKIFWIN